MRILYLFLVLTSLALPVSTTAQANPGSELFQLLEAQDSLLFHAAFNTCEEDVLRQVFSTDFEFYHDQSGMTLGREKFIGDMKNICGPDVRQSKRILIPGSLQVHPLKNRGEVYGAIQQGEHRFEFINDSGEWQRGSIANFTNLWILEEEGWKIRRILSYNHRHSGDK